LIRRDSLNSIGESGVIGIIRIQTAEDLLAIAGEIGRAHV